MNSDKLVYLFGPPSDVYITDNKKATSFMHADGEAELDEYLDELADEFTKEGMPCTARIRMIYTYQVEYEGNTYSYSFEQDWRSNVSEFKMAEGVAPSNEREVAITKQFTELTGAKIGDTIRIDYGDKKEELLITGCFQSMNQLGKVILLHEDAPTDFSHLTSPSQFMIDFTDNPDQKTIDERVKKIKDLTGNDEVFNATEFCVDCVKVYDIMDAVYNNASANRNLRDYSFFLSEHLDHDYVVTLIDREFSRFFERNLCQYADYDRLPVAFVGSVATTYSELLLDVASRYGVHIQKIVRNSMPGLVTYHTGGH